MNPLQNFQINTSSKTNSNNNEVEVFSLNDVKEILRNVYNYFSNLPYPRLTKKDKKENQHAITVSSLKEQQQSNIIWLMNMPL